MAYTSKGIKNKKHSQNESQLTPPPTPSPTAPSRCKSSSRGCACRAKGWQTKLNFVLRINLITRHGSSRDRGRGEGGKAGVGSHCLSAGAEWRVLSLMVALNGQYQIMRCIVLVRRGVPCPSSFPFCSSPAVPGKLLPFTS